MTISDPEGWLTEEDHEFFRFWDRVIAIPSDSFAAVWGEEPKPPPPLSKPTARPGETWLETRIRCQAEHDARRGEPWPESRLRYELDNARRR